MFLNISEKSFKDCIQFLWSSKTKMEIGGGYTFRLDAKWKCGYEPQLKNDCEKLLKWCESWQAHAKLINYMWWYNEVKPSNEYDFKCTRDHQRKALREGWRNHAYLVISDPVANRFEKDGFYKEVLR